MVSRHGRYLQAAGSVSYWGPACFNEHYSRVGFKLQCLIQLLPSSPCSTVCYAALVGSVDAARKLFVGEDREKASICKCAGEGNGAAHTNVPSTDACYHASQLAPKTPPTLALNNCALHGSYK